MPGARIQEERVTESKDLPAAANTKELTMHTSPWLKLGLVFVVFLSLSVAANAARPDAWITMKAKTALYAAPDVHGTDINVDTINGRVSLYGTVASQTEKARAEEEVRKIEGVVDVRNLLKVGDTGKSGHSDQGQAEKSKRSDQAIKNDVEKALKADRSLDDSSITVKSVDNGVVMLSGRAASPDDNLRAIRVARSQPGVAHVKVETESPDTYSDEEFRCEKTGSATPTASTNEPGKSASSASRSAGAAVTDVWITSATKMKLAADSRTPATDINVDTYDGVVTLFGMVASNESKSAATEIAKSVNGVKRVENKLEVVAAWKEEAVQAKDDTIKDGVEKSLKDRGAQENASIGVEVSNGVVRLTGKVPSYERGLTAVYVARGVPGVRSVRNELKVDTDHAS